MNRFQNILILGVLFGILFLIFFLDFHWRCPIKQIFGLSCPACGLTRSFQEILHFHFWKSFSYNILGLPLFLAGLWSIGMLIRDIGCNTNRFQTVLLTFLQKYAVWIFLDLGLNMVINSIRNI